MLEEVIILIINKEEVLLGEAIKEEGFSFGKINGYGGKREPPESLQECAVREVYEESKLEVKQEDLENFGFIDFHFKNKPSWSRRVHYYLLEYEKLGGQQPQQTKEMKPFWINKNNLPYSRMWPADEHYFKDLLERKRVEAVCTYTGDNKQQQKLEIVFTLPEKKTITA
ncbi:MAG: 8-oxo-dGTP diphosphatase [Candidatus Woesearchaeota archaeon]